MHSHLRLAACLVILHPAVAQEFNYDEAKVPAYELPDPLEASGGHRVESAEQWREVRRPEVLRLFEEHVYGRTPDLDVATRARVTDVEEHALGGKATRVQVTLTFGEEDDAPWLDLLMFLPNQVDGPAPAFLGLNFFGNHSVHPDPAIALARSWLGNKAEYGVVDHRATEAGRGKRAHRWPVETIVGRGYALVTAAYGDLDPDFDDGFANGVHVLDPAERGQTSWGSIGAWAWGLSRALDYLERDDRVDASRVALLGHSRLGKTALWAGAQDERFALVISNDSGCGGAALSRRRYGETVERITRAFPHWFCGTFAGYANREDALPVDQHLLIALIAPRPVYVASAEQDRWADPRGEFLAVRHADPVYRLLGLPGLGEQEPPPVHTPVGETAGYHLRRGKHDVTDYDWTAFLDFADRHLGAKER